MLTGRGVLLFSHRRRWKVAAGTTGGNGGQSCGHGQGGGCHCPKVLGVAGRLCLDRERDERTWFFIFPIYPKPAQPYLAPKIPNFCTLLSWDIMNNFLDCANIQFPT
jgi:hypothetical protein